MTKDTITEKKIEDVVIIGSGPAGYTAAIYAARADLKPLVIDGVQPGGQLTTTTDVENYPGFPDGLMGPDMMDAFRKQATRFGTRFLSGTVSTVKTAAAPFAIRADDQNIFTKSVIIATGASAKYLGLENETKLLGHGVSACATCDGFFYRNKIVCVIGGGDTAMEESLFLTKFASKVILIHRRDAFRASKVMQKRVMEHVKIEILWNTVVSDVLGTKETGLTGVMLDTREPGSESSTQQELQCDGMFVAIGHKPNSDPFLPVLDHDTHGYLVVKPGTTQTSIPGIFACGDVADPVYRQAVSAAGTGCMAAIDAERWLSQ